MCGICGHLSLDGRPADRAAVERMAAALIHRGPDEHGLHLEGPVALASRRLRVVDPEGGHQPMANEDGSVTLVFNGEIYNFAELRQRLEQKGHRFRSRSDTETVVRLYQERGDACVEELRGMFAFALWDSTKRRLLLARDRLGKKPLYLARNASGLWFASELKALLGVPGLALAINPVALELYLTYRYVPGPRTILAGVTKLLPGHVMSVAGETTKLWRYWDYGIPCAEGPQDDAAACAELTALFTESVKLRTVADVPLGAFLSGGLDSSLVVAHLARYGSGPVKTFSVGFPGHGGLDELAHARRVSRHFATDHHELAIGPSDVLAAFPEVVWHLDEPLADAAAVPTLMLSRLARRDVTVALSGEGADELFAGYPHYRRERDVGRVERFVPRRVAAALARVLATTGPRRLARAARLVAMSRAARHRSYRAVFDLAPLAAPAHSLADAVLHLTLAELQTWLPDDLLMKLDKTSMAVSLEARAPFLDHRVVEFAIALPTRFKLRGATDKWILREVAKAVLPPEIASREKHGFDLPLGSWLGRELRPLVDELLGPAGLVRRGLVPDSVLAQVAPDRADLGPAAAQRLWTLMCLEQWCRLYLDART